MAAKLKALRPDDYAYYVEPYFGGGSLFFACDPVSVETINDLDSNVMDFYRVLRDLTLYSQFEALAQRTVHSRELYTECCRKWAETEDLVLRVWMWWVVVREGFGGHFGVSWASDVTHSRRGMAGNCSKLFSAIEALPLIHQRLARVQIECADAVTVIERYGVAGAFVFCDPPYVHSTRDEETRYQVEMTDDDHRRLVDVLLASPAQVMLCGYEHEVYNPLTAAGWYRQEFKTGCYATPRTKATGLQGEGSVLKGAARTEVVWMNYSDALPEADL